MLNLFQGIYWLVDAFPQLPLDSSDSQSFAYHGLSFTSYGFIWLLTHALALVQATSQQNTLGTDAMAYTQHIGVRKVAEYFQLFWIQEHPNLWDSNCAIDISSSSPIRHPEEEPSSYTWLRSLWTTSKCSPDRKILCWSWAAINQVQFVLILIFWTSCSHTAGSEMAT